MALHTSVCLSQDQPAIAAHCFKEGMKLEAVDPAAPISIRPATVTRVTEFPIKSVSSVLSFAPASLLSYCSETQLTASYWLDIHFVFQSRK